MIAALVWLIVTPVSVLTLAFALEVFVGLAPLQQRELLASAPSVVIVPAHNEEKGIGATVASLLTNLPPLSRLLIVADNCSDDTAAIAQAVGAEVITRSDPRRGKGHALAFARDHLAVAPPVVVVVVDADCRVDAVSLTALVATGAQAPAQAVNLLMPDAAHSAMVQVSTFAFLIKNLVRQRGLMRLSKRVLLTGTGMALPWRAFADAPIATSNIVEDLALGLYLTEAGFEPQLVERATAWSPASKPGATLQQRQRWEGGFLASSLKHALPGLARAVARLDGRAAWAALSLAIPPIALLVLLDLLALGLASASGLIGFGWLPAAVVLASLFALVAALASTWIRLGRGFLTPSAAARLPLYLLWKLPLYASLLRGKPKVWQRTERD